MRRDVLELREFYAQPLGRAVREMLSRKIAEAWGDAAGLDVMGFGYATPFLDGFVAARRVVAAMPAAQGVEGLAGRRAQPRSPGGGRRPAVPERPVRPHPDRPRPGGERRGRRPVAGGRAGALALGPDHRGGRGAGRALVPRRAHPLRPRPPVHPPPARTAGARGRSRAGGLVPGAVPAAPGLRSAAGPKGSNRSAPGSGRGPRGWCCWRRSSAASRSRPSRCAQG